MAESAAQDFGLNGRTEGHGLIRILRGVELRALGFVVVVAQSQVSAGLLEFRATEPLSYRLSDQRHAGLPTDQDDLIEILGLEFGIGECAQAVRPSLLDDSAGEGFEFHPSDAPQKAKFRGEKGELDLRLSL